MVVLKFYSVPFYSVCIYISHLACKTARKGYLFFGDIFKCCLCFALIVFCKYIRENLEKIKLLSVLKYVCIISICPSQEVGHLNSKSRCQDLYIVFSWEMKGQKICLVCSLTLLLLNRSCHILANSVDPGQLASKETNWSGSALFVIWYVNFYQKCRSSNLISWKFEKGVAS